MSIEIPNQKIRRWSGPYLGNYYGDLWRTFNIDLDRNPGHVSLSYNFNKTADTNSSNMTHLKVIDNFTRTNADGSDKWWALSRQGRLCKTDTSFPLALSTATWLEDALANSPTDAQDMTVHENDSDSAAGENRLFVTRSADIAVLNDTAANTWIASWWVSTKSQTALKAGLPHPIEYFPNLRISLVGDGNWVHTIDKSENISYQRLILPPYLQIWGIFTTPLRAWILCGGLQGHNGAIVEWDGFSQTYNAIHDCQSKHVISGVDYSGIPIVVNSRGLILEFTGNGFTPMIRNGQKICFPSFSESENGFLFPDYVNGMYMSPRGMTVNDDGLIHINIQGPFSASPRHLAGVWCLDPIIGRLYSKYSFSLGASSTDYGHQNLPPTGPGAGAIKATSTEAGSGFTAASAAYLLAGAQINTNHSGGGLRPALWTLPRGIDGQTVRHGYFITQYIPANDITEMWDSVWIKLNAFKSSTNDQIIIKAQGVNILQDSNRLPLELTITWTSANTFTAQNGNGTANDNILVGDEIEVMDGKNAGQIAHITQISGAQGATQTFTIDENCFSTSGDSLCRFDRWKKLGIINDITKYAVPQKIGIDSSFLRLKVELRGIPKDFEVKSLIINPDPQQKAKK